MKYYVAIIMYNPDKEAINNFKNYSEHFEQVFLFDNSTSSIHRNLIINTFKNEDKYVYISMEGNKGISKVLESAFDNAINADGDFLLTMDQDSFYDKENISHMIQYIESNYNQNVAIYSANFRKTYFDNGKEVYEDYRIERGTINEINMAITSGSWYNLTPIKEILPLDDFFVGFVDNDISTSLLELGYKIIRVGNSCFNQKIGGNVNNSIFNKLFKVIHHNDIRYYYMARNIHYYKDKHPEINIKIFYCKWWIRIIFNIIIAEKHKRKKFKACYKGYVDYKKKRYGGVISE